MDHGTETVKSGAGVVNLPPFCNFLVKEMKYFS